MACIIIRDGFGDVHATEAHFTSHPGQLLELAENFCESLPLEEGEIIEIGVANASDPGAARLLTGQFGWLGTMRVQQRGD